MVGAGPITIKVPAPSRHRAKIFLPHVRRARAGSCIVFFARCGILVSQFINGSFLGESSGRVRFMICALLRLLVQCGIVRGMM